MKRGFFKKLNQKNKKYPEKYSKILDLPARMCVCGSSQSGKSMLVYDLIYNIIDIFKTKNKELPYFIFWVTGTNQLNDKNIQFIEDTENCEEVVNIVINIYKDFYKLYPNIKTNMLIIFDDFICTKANSNKKTSLLNN